MAIGEIVNSIDILDEATMLLGRGAYTGIREYAVAFEALHRWAKICLQMNYEAKMVACLEKLAKIRWQLNPGSLESVRWLAAAASWRDTATLFVEEEFDRRFLEKVKDQVSENAFSQSWAEGLQRTVPEALAVAASSLPVL